MCELGFSLYYNTHTDTRALTRVIVTAA